MKAAPVALLTCCLALTAGAYSIAEKERIKESDDKFKAFIVTMNTMCGTVGWTKPRAPRPAARLERRTMASA